MSGTVVLHKGTVGNDLDAESGLYEGVAFASQLPWLQHDSIRNNILFGSPMEEDRYASVIDACALQADLAMFDAGDETGESFASASSPLADTDLIEQRSERRASHFQAGRKLVLLSRAQCTPVRGRSFSTTLSRPSILTRASSTGSVFCYMLINFGVIVRSTSSASA